MMDRLLVKPAELAAALGLSRSLVYQLIASGQLRAVRIGRAVRVRVDDLEEFIEERIEGGPPTAGGSMA